MPHTAETSWQGGELGGADASRSSDAARLWVTGLLIGSLALLAVPVLVARIPPLLDYPNHLVRLWLVTGGADAPPLSQMFAVSWGSAFTNVGIDYLGALLGDSCRRCRWARLSSCSRSCCRHWGLQP